MAPKRKLSESSVEAQTETNKQIETNPEEFIKSFAKPTKIYKFLRLRHTHSPIFLHRNVSYLRQRSHRKSGSRKTFQIDQMLNKIQQTKKGFRQEVKLNGTIHLNIEAFRVHDEKLGNMSVQVTLCQNVIGRRKIQRKNLELRNIGTFVINRIQSPSKRGKVAIPLDNLVGQDAAGTRNYWLLFKISPYEPANSPGKGSPAPKKRRRDDDKHFVAQLPIYDRVLLVEEGMHVIPAEPTSDSPVPDCISRQESLPNGLDDSDQNSIEDSPHLQVYIRLENTTSNKKATPSKKQTKEKSEVVTKDVCFRFIHKNVVRQNTISHDGFFCPWCRLNCMQIEGLMRHLTLYHLRFFFKVTTLPNYYRIDVSLNDTYDGLQVGFPFDYCSYVGREMRPQGPMKRKPLTVTLVAKLKRSKFANGDMYDDAELDMLSNRVYREGHNRLCYHTGTNQAVRPEEIDVDSEDENDPLWMRQKTIHLIEEFVDVNEGEKAMMLKWNLFVMKNNHIGDNQLFPCCMEFVRKLGHEIISENLVRNFNLHICNLFDYGLISSTQMSKIFRSLFSPIKCPMNKMINVNMIQCEK